MINPGFAWMTGTVVCYSATAVATREVSFQIDTPSILFLRSLISVALVVCLAGFSGAGFAQLRTRRIRVHVVRNCTHFVGQFGWFYSIALIPLAHVFAIEFTVPLWLAMLAPIFLKEKLTMQRLGFILLGFAGILVVVRPFGADFNPASLVMLAGALGFASAMMATRDLAKTETPVSILFYMAILQLPMSTLLLAFTGELQIPDLRNFCLIVFITCGIMLAHYCTTRAVSHAELLLIIPVDYVRLPLIAIAGALLYGESITTMTVVGSALILAANYMNVRYGAR